MELFISVGERLREVREALGKTQTEFAEIAAQAGAPGATRQSQARYEKGQASPSAAYLAAIAGAGADVTYVLTGCRSGALPPMKMSQTMGEVLDVAERKLLRDYRQASDAGRKLIRDAAAVAAKVG